MQNAATPMVPLADYQKLESEIQDLKQRIAWFERMMFGRKSERFVPAEEIEGQLKLAFAPEQAQEVEATVKQLIAEHERSVPPKKENAHKGRQPIPPHLPRVTEVLEPEEDTSGMKRIGEDISEVLEYEPGKVWVRRTVRPKYARMEAELEPGQGQIVQAPAKELPFGRSKAGVSLIVHILIAKYVEHLPLHRLIARFARSGLKVPPPTIGNWVKTGAEPLMILYEAYQNAVFGSSYLQMDETRLKVLEDGRGRAHLGYLWAVFSPIHKLPFFFYEKGRDHHGPKKFLERFAGVLQCDGYSVYKTLDRKLASIALMNCMAHIRREFFEAQGTDAERAQTALTMIKILYLVEEKARLQGLDAEQRLELRLKESKPAFDTLGQWLQTEYDKVTPSSAIGKAIQYALNRWKNMAWFLADGNIEIDNNLVENIIRPAAIGRKNYLFAGSHEAAQRTAMFYTFFAACKHHGIDPEKWLTDVLNRIHDHKVSQLHELFPQNWKPAAE
ncbi:MAG: IS66 family transposase [Lewinellaceae bacterium]|nr:IS66 family transposase [Lewinellaceae bacterium]MCB9036467.1 IS66 family transposase [Lewinellaceae bacterium]MCB9036975.1 IS66 family transposase [Lewinellaceae bacterium]